jgi:hypothetical protein
MFDAFGVPGKLYYTFVAFNQLTKTPNRVACDWQGEPLPQVTICAGVSDDRKTASILVSNFDAVPKKAAIRLQNLPQSQPVQAETFAIDATHALASLGKAKAASDQPAMILDLPGNSVYLVRLEAVATK